MSTPAQPKAELIRRSAMRNAGVSVWLLLLAALASMLFHGGLVALLIYVLEAPTQARPQLETRIVENLIVRANDSPKNLDKLTGQTIDLQAGKSDTDFNHKSEVTAPVTNPGVSDTLKPPGVELGEKDRPAIDIPKSFGTGSTKPGARLDDLKAPGKPVLEGLPPGTDADTLRKFAGGPFGRTSSMRKALVSSGGGSNASEKAVEDGLKFLARIQQSDGSWRFQYAEFGDRGTPIADDVSPTALALLPFLGRGCTNEPMTSDGAGGQDSNEYFKVVDKAVKHLVRRQDAKTGVIRAPSAATADCYDAHCLATLALCELYTLSKDAAFKERLKRFTLEPALRALADQQLKDGGWRFFNRPDLPLANMFVTGWVIQALRSAELAGLPASDGLLAKAGVFVERCVDSPTQGYRYSYNLRTDGKPAHQPNFTESTAGLLCRMHLEGWGATKVELLIGIENWILKFDGDVPKFAAEGRKDKNQVFYWFFANQVMHHLGRDYWTQWNAWLRDELVLKQCRGEGNPNLVGSWDPPKEQQDDEPGFVGGRLLCTSLAILTLEVYYRQLPLYWRDIGMNQK